MTHASTTLKPATLVPEARRMAFLPALFSPALMLIGGQAFETALAHFYDRWKEEPLVVDKWFALQAASSRPDTLARVRSLLAHPNFDARNPNRQEFLAWLRKLVFKYPAETERFLVGESTKVTVPCMVLDLT